MKILFILTAFLATAFAWAGDQTGIPAGKWVEFNSAVYDELKKEVEASSVLSAEEKIEVISHLDSDLKVHNSWITMVRVKKTYDESEKLSIESRFDNTTSLPQLIRVFNNSVIAQDVLTQKNSIADENYYEVYNQCENYINQSNQYSFIGGWAPCICGALYGINKGWDNTWEFLGNALGNPAQTLVSFFTPENWKSLWGELEKLHGELQSDETPFERKKALNCSSITQLGTEILLTKGGVYSVKKIASAIRSTIVSGDLVMASNLASALSNEMILGKQAFIKIKPPKMLSLSSDKMNSVINQILKKGVTEYKRTLYQVKNAPIQLSKEAQGVMYEVFHPDLSKSLILSYTEGGKQIVSIFKKVEYEFLASDGFVYESFAYHNGKLLNRGVMLKEGEINSLINRPLNPVPGSVSLPFFKNYKPMPEEMIPPKIDYPSLPSTIVNETGM